MNGVCPAVEDKYVVVEGLDLAGKSSLIKKFVEATGWISVNEPYTGNEFAAEVKRQNNANYLPKHYEMMSIIAGRIDCFDEVIDKHRYSGVIADRCVVSSMVYQSTERFSPHNVLTLNKSALLLAGHDIFPTDIFFLDIRHSTFLDRLAANNRTIDEKDLFLKDPDNWKELRTKYVASLELMTKWGVKVHQINEHTTVGEMQVLLGLIKPE